MLQLPVSAALQKSSFKLALTLSYQLEAERDLIHETHFMLQQWHLFDYGQHYVPLLGTFSLKPVKELPEALSSGRPYLILRDELGDRDV